MKNETFLTTGDTIMKRHNWKMTVPKLENWPEGYKFILSDEVEEIGKQIIETFRKDLTSFKIGYVFKQKASKSDNGVILGQAKSENELQRVLHGLDAVIIIAYDEWVQAEPDSKFSLIFHELEHFIVDEKSGGLKTITHTVENFPSVIREFGPSSIAEVMFIEAYEKFRQDNGR